MAPLGAKVATYWWSWSGPMVISPAVTMYVPETVWPVASVRVRAAEVVKAERNKRTGSSGHFASVAYTSSTQRKGALVGLRNTGRGSNDYIGVNEFGGSVPRHNSKYRSHFKPWIGGGAGSSYYLYPALEDKRPEITEKYQQEVKRLCDRYMP